MSNPHTLLLPNWLPGQSYIYTVFKKEIPANSKSPVLEKSYPVEIRIIDSKSLEVYYPSSILQISAYFDELKEYLPELIDAGLKTIYVTVEPDFDHFYLTNMASIRNQIKVIKNKLLSLVQRKNDQKKIRKKINLLLNDEEVLAQCFLEDMYWMFEFYGINRFENTCIDINESAGKVGEFVEVIAGHLLKGTKQIDLASFSYTESEDYKVELINASIKNRSQRDDLQKAQDDFINHRFDVRNFPGIKTYHKVFLFDANDWSLNRLIFCASQGIKEQPVNKIVEIKRTD